MAFIPVPDAVHVQMIMADDGQVCMNDLYFNAGGTPTAGDLATLVVDLNGWWAANYAPNVCDTVLLLEVRAQDMGSTTGAYASYLSAEAGAVTSEQAPNNVAPCISFRTPFRGRSSRGRNYIVGLPNAMVNINTMDSAFTIAMRTCYEQLLPGGSVTLPGLYEWVVVSRYTGGAPRTTGVFFNVVSCGFVDNTVDSQRRRLPGRGR